MRNLIVTMITLAALAACGASGKEVAQAKQARYRGDKLELFTLAKTATEAKYKLQKSDEVALGMQTTGRWYNPEGLGISAGADDVERDVKDQSINLTLVVELLPEGDSWVVAVKPVMLRYTQGQAQPMPLDPRDPSVPGWVHGRVDQLQVAIWEKLRPYEVKAVGGIAPPPAAPPGPTPMPDEGAAPAEPAAGSPDPAADSAAPAPQ